MVGFFRGGTPRSDRTGREHSRGFLPEYLAGCTMGPRRPLKADDRRQTHQVHRAFDPAVRIVLPAREKSEQGTKTRSAMSTQMVRHSRHTHVPPFVSSVSLHMHPTSTVNRQPTERTTIKSILRDGVQTAKPEHATHRSPQACDLEPVRSKGPRLDAAHDRLGLSGYVSRKCASSQASGLS